VADINDIRNIVLLGHGSSGKTMLAEAILHKAGMTNRLADVCRVQRQAHKYN
jgi:elongation factor G